MSETIYDLATPALVVDLDRVEANLQRVQAYADAQGVDLRPHSKTHKTPHFARAQLAAGAVGICVAKLGEGERMADAGIDDVVMPNTVIGVDKAARAVALAQRVRFAIGVDHHEQLRQLAAAALTAARPLEVLLEVDVGSWRGGAAGEALPALAQAIFEAPGLQLRGVYAYEGFTYPATDRADLIDRHQAAQRALLVAAEDVRPWAVGDAAQGGRMVVSLGSTPSALGAVPLLPGINEMRPGTYIFGDLQQARWAAGDDGWQAGLDAAAAHVMASVVSLQHHPDGSWRALLDAGSKTLTSDSAVGHAGFGYLVDHGLTITRLSEEHAVVEAPAGKAQPTVGAKVRVLMIHVCPVVNLFSEMVLVRAGVVESRLPVSGRGATV